MPLTQSYSEVLLCQWLELPSRKGDGGDDPIGFFELFAGKQAVSLAMSGPQIAIDGCKPYIGEMPAMLQRATTGTLTGRR